MPFADQLSDAPAVVSASIADNAALYIVCVDTARCTVNDVACFDNGVEVESKPSASSSSSMVSASALADAIVRDVVDVYQQAVDLTTRSSTQLAAKARSGADGGGDGDTRLSIADPPPPRTLPPTSAVHPENVAEGGIATLVPQSGGRGDGSGATAAAVVQAADAVVPLRPRFAVVLTKCDDDDDGAVIEDAVLAGVVDEVRVRVRRECGDGVSDGAAGAGPCMGVFACSARVGTGVPRVLAALLG